MRAGAGWSLGDGSDADLAGVEILGNGYRLHWPTLALPDSTAGLLGMRI